MHTHIHIHTHIHTYTYIYIHTSMHTYIHTYIFIYTHTQIHTHTYLHTYTHIHTHTHSSCTPVAWVNLCDPKSLLCIVATSTIGSCTFTIGSCSLLCAAMGTVLHHHTALDRSQTLCAFSLHAQNKPWGWVLKVAHWNPLPSLTVSTASPNRSQRPNYALPHAFILFRSQ